MQNTNCNLCNYCETCNSCNSCNYCFYCNICNSCNSCDSCNSCTCCINLKDTSYNYFCFADKYNDNNSVQQKKYRVFNTEISKEEYEKIEQIHIELDLKNKTYREAFIFAWEKIPQEEKDKVLNLSQFNEKAFQKYYGVELLKPAPKISLKDKYNEFINYLKLTNNLKLCSIGLHKYVRINKITISTEHTQKGNTWEECIHCGKKRNLQGFSILPPF